MQLAGLGAIAKISNMNTKNKENRTVSSSTTGGDLLGETNDNNLYDDELYQDDGDVYSVWSKLCDVTTCIESPITANSPTGYAIDAAGAMQTSADGSSYMSRDLPKPPESVACILPPEKFKVTSVVHRAEHLDISESPISLPSRYTKALQSQVEGIQQLRKKLSTVDMNNGSIVEKTINNNFIDWLVQTEKTNHIIDLIKMDRIGRSIGGANAATSDTDTGTRDSSAAECKRTIGGLVMDNEDDDDLFMHTTVS